MNESTGKTHVFHASKHDGCARPIGSRRSSRYLIAAATIAVTAPTFAQSEAQDGLEEIVVTARRKEERLQDVPISITVFNQDQLNNRNVTSLRDLETYTPSLSANTRFGANNGSFAIRGFTQSARTSASVAVYFADVVAPRAGIGGTPAGDGAGPGSFFDLQNVQVLKGPQGTLFGRNTTGGAVLLVPTKPGDEFGGYAEASYGNYDMMRGQAVLNVPLSEAVRFRLGVDTQSRDGYLENISGVGPREFGDLEYTTVRASVVVDLTPNLENYTIASYSEAQDNGPMLQVTNCTNTFPFGILACQQIARQANSDFYTVQNNFPDPESTNEQWQVINTTSWLASDNLTVKNIASYAQLENTLNSELFGVQFVIPTQFGPIPNTGALAGRTLGFANSFAIPGYNTSADQYSFTEELQLQGRTSGDEFVWQVGAYYEESNPLHPTGTQSALLLSCTDQANFQCQDVIGQLIRRPGLGSIGSALGTTSFRNLGIYSQATYQLAEKWKLTGGLRYTKDKTTAESRQVTYRFLTPNVATGFCTWPGGVPQNVPVTSLDQCPRSATQESDAPTWLLDLDYNPTDDVMLYAKYSRGYRQGATNVFAPLEFATFEPEEVDAYEIGTKTSFRGAIAGTFNIALFYNDFTDQQIQVNLSSSTNAATPTSAIFNAGESRITGVEVDSTISPFRGFTLAASYAYLDTELKSLAAIAPTAGSAYDIFRFTSTPGSRLANTPDHKASATATYDLPIPLRLGELSVSATYSYASDYLIVDGPFGTLPSLELVNLNLNWNSVLGTAVDLSLFGTNVTDEEYYVNVSDQSSQGFVSQLPGQPRMYGMRVRYRFGAE